MANIKVFHVQIHDNHYYFGSKKAIFDTFSKEEIGIAYNSFRNVKNLDKIPFSNGKCLIREGVLIQSTQNKINNITKETSIKE